MDKKSWCLTTPLIGVGRRRIREAMAMVELSWLVEVKIQLAMVITGYESSRVFVDPCCIDGHWPRPAVRRKGCTVIARHLLMHAMVSLNWRAWCIHSMPSLGACAWHMTRELAAASHATRREETKMSQFSRQSRRDEGWATELN